MLIRRILLRIISCHFNFALVLIVLAAKTREAFRRFLKSANKCIKRLKAGIFPFYKLILVKVNLQKISLSKVGLENGMQLLAAHLNAS